MISFDGKKYWIIGASEGLGRSLARLLVAEGAKVILSARNADRLGELASELPNSRALPVDVTDASAVQKAANSVGMIDGVVLCVGAYEPMPTAAWNTLDALKMINAHLIGSIHVLGHIVPEFCKRNQGDITIIGSLAGYRGLPNAIGYSASKAALRSLAETMRFDLRGTGVVVRLVNPGFIETRLTKKNNFSMPMIMTPEQAAKKVLKAMRRTRFRTDFPAPFSWFIRALDYAPDWLVYRFK